VGSPKLTTGAADDVVDVAVVEERPKPPAVAEPNPPAEEPDKVSPPVVVEAAAGWDVAGVLVRPPPKPNEGLVAAGAPNAAGAAEVVAVVPSWRVGAAEVVPPNEKPGMDESS
jgi:hypothetical protein